MPVPTPDAPYLAIFDHDGVLVDSLALHQQAWLEMGRHSGLAVTPEFLHETLGMTTPGFFRRLRGEGISEDDIRRYGDMKEVCYRDGAGGRICLMEGVRE